MPPRRNRETAQQRADRELANSVRRDRRIHIQRIRQAERQERLEIRRRARDNEGLIQEELERQILNDDISGVFEDDNALIHDEFEDRELENVLDDVELLMYIQQAEAVVMEAKKKYNIPDGSDDSRDYNLNNNNIRFPPPSPIPTTQIFREPTPPPVRFPAPSPIPETRKRPHPIFELEEVEETREEYEARYKRQQMQSPQPNTQPPSPSTPSPPPSPQPFTQPITPPLPPLPDDDDFDDDGGDDGGDDGEDNEDYVDAFLRQPMRIPPLQYDYIDTDRSDYRYVVLHTHVTQFADNNEIGNNAYGLLFRQVLCMTVNNGGIVIHTYVDPENVQNYAPPPPGIGALIQPFNARYFFNSIYEYYWRVSMERTLYNEFVQRAVPLYPPFNTRRTIAAIPIGFKDIRVGNHEAFYYILNFAICIETGRVNNIPRYKSAFFPDLQSGIFAGNPVYNTQAPLRNNFGILEQFTHRFPEWAEKGNMNRHIWNRVGVNPATDQPLPRDMINLFQFRAMVNEGMEVFDALNIRRYVNGEEIRTRVNDLYGDIQIRLRFVSYYHYRDRYGRLRYETKQTHTTKPISFIFDDSSFIPYLHQKLQLNKDSFGHDVENLDRVWWDTSWFSILQMKEDVLGPIENVFDTDNDNYIIYDDTLNHDPTMTCIPAAVDALGLDSTALLDVSDIEKLVQYIIDNQLSISIVYNTPEYKFGNINNKFLRQTKRKQRKILQTCDVTHNWFYRTPFGGEEMYIVFDQFHNHVKALRSLNIRQNVFCSSLDIVRKIGDEEYMAYGPMHVPREVINDEEDRETRFIYYNIAYVCDHSDGNIITPFSITYIELTMDQMSEMSHQEDDEVSSLLNNTCYTIIGTECVERFIENLYQLAIMNHNIIWKLCGHNIQSGQNMILLQAISNTNIPDLVLKRINYVSFAGRDEIQDIHFFGNRFSLLDIESHLCAGECITDAAMKGGLKNYVAMYSNRERKVENQHNFNMWGIAELINNTILDNNFKVDMERDVCAMAVLFYRYLSFLINIPSVKNIYEGAQRLKTAWQYPSIYSYMFALQSAYTEKNKISFPKLTYSQYNFIKRDMTGGRVQCQEKTIVDERVISADFNACYASCMTILPNTYFMGGVLSDSIITQGLVVDMFRTHNSVGSLGKIGWFEVDIDQSKIRDRGGCLIRALKTDDGNLFDYETATKQKRVVLSHYMIEFMLKQDCEVEFCIGGRCLTFSRDYANHEVFGWLGDILKEKIKQDNLKGTSEYNGSNKLWCKAALNGLFGFLCKNIEEEKTMCISTHVWKSGKFLTTDMVKDSAKLLYNCGDGLVVITYKINRRTEAEKRTCKPVYIGRQIIEYGMLRGYELFMGKTTQHPERGLDAEDVLYYDTDSCKFKASLLQNKLAHLYNTPLVVNNLGMAIDDRYTNAVIYSDDPKLVLPGGLKDEFDNRNNKTILLGKKKWASFYINNQGNIEWSKAAVVGINRYAILLDEFCPFVGRNVEEDRYYVTNQGAADEYAYEHRDETLHHPKILYKAFTDSAAGKEVLIMPIMYRVNDTKDGVTSRYIIKKI